MMHSCEAVVSYVLLCTILWSFFLTKYEIVQIVDFGSSQSKFDLTGQ